MWATAVTLLISGLVSAAAIGWLFRDRAAQSVVARGAIQLALEEVKKSMTQRAWVDALAAVKRAEYVQANQLRDPEMSAQIQDYRRDIEMVMRLETVAIPAHKDDSGLYSNNRTIYVQFNRSETLGPQLAQAFREYGIDLNSLEPAESGKQIRSRRIWRELVAAIDLWANWCRVGNDTTWKELLAVARTADPDPVRDRLRDVVGLAPTDRRSALITLAVSVSAEDVDPQTAVSLAHMLVLANAADEAVAHLRIIQQRNPNDFSVNKRLGECLLASKSPNHDDVIRFNTAALAIRPNDRDCWRSIGCALYCQGRSRSSDRDL